MNDREALKVSELNELIREVLNNGFPNTVWVCGEVQGYDRNKDKKHIFFELCEKAPNSDEIIARVPVVVFVGKKLYLEEILARAENGFQLKDDIEVKLLCRVDFYPPHGAVRLTIESIDPVYTLGKIAQGRQKLILELKKKGVLDKNKTLEIPAVPMNIGLVTAYDSAAYNDFLSELKKSGFAFRVFFVSALMQGKRAEPSVCRALDSLEKLEELDVIVITRGGGSIAELSCFDSKMIAERIAACRLPVLSGIGHEINVTVTDMAACHYEKTPTAIAGFFIDRVKEFISEIESRGSVLVELGKNIVERERSRLKDFAQSFQRSTVDLFKAQNQKIFGLREGLKIKPGQILKDRQKIVLNEQAAFIKMLAGRLKDVKGTVTAFEKMVFLASPAQTLKRGFSITRAADGKVARSIKQFTDKDIIFTEVLDGAVKSQVIELPPNKQNSKTLISVDSDSESFRVEKEKLNKEILKEKNDGGYQIR